MLAFEPLPYHRLCELSQRLCQHEATAFAIRRKQHTLRPDPHIPLLAVGQRLTRELVPLANALRPKALGKRAWKGTV